MSYKKIIGTFKSEVDQTDLFYFAWINKPFNPEKCIVVHHGFGEHSGRYQNIIDTFEGSGYSLFIMDMRGHGLSGGARGAAPDFDSYVNDLNSFINFSQLTHGIDKPILLGHSLGGLIALSYCLKFDTLSNVKALVANGSLLSFQFTPMTLLKRVVGNYIVKFLPEARASVGLNTKYISHDKNVVKAYNKDELVHGTIKIKIADEIVNKGLWCIDHACDLRIPVLLTHGGKDKISQSKGAIKFYENCGSIDKTLIVYDDLYHEVYNEIKKDKPLNDLRNWIVSHS